MKADTRNAASAASSEGVGGLRFHVAVQRSRAIIYAATYPIGLGAILTGVMQASIWSGSALIACGVASAILFELLYRSGRGTIFGIELSIVGLFIDTALVSWGVYISGGWASPWYLFFLANAAGAAFVGGRNAVLMTATANAVGYLTAVILSGSARPFDKGFVTALFYVGFLYFASFFFLRGVANLRDKRMQIRQLRDEDRRRVEELTRLTEELGVKSRELSEANRKIREADRLKSQFLANMSHELRTPMNAIIGFSEILVERLSGRVEPKYENFMQHILASGQHLLGIINDVLDLSKVEAGRMEVFPEQFALQGAAEGVCSVMRAQAAKSEIDIVLDVAEGLPAIETDLAKFKQILYNLVSNAVKFSPSKSKVTVRVRLDVAPGAEQGDYVSVAVIDQGIGIAPENQEAVFQEFHQLDSGSRKEFAGTGLGLALVKRFCELLGGAISVESETGRGSTFTFTLPLRYRGPEPVDEHPADAPYVPSDAPGDRVLVIEDDSVAFASLARHLESAGYVPVRARHGDEALKLSKLVRPVAITLDLVLPGVDGWEVLKRLKADEATREIPVVVISMIDNRELGFALGAHDYFVKPVDRRRLVDRIRQVTSPVKKRGRTRLLVIDDDSAFRAMLDEELRELGYDIRWASSGEEGLEAARADVPDVVVLDLVMPGMSGFEVAERLKQDSATENIPILVMTSKDLSSSDRSVLQSKIAALVPKGRSSGSRLITAIQQLGR
ncbi:MAG: response regulator [Thermoanaerobaculia bacterium]|jgi:signal transduction histidine kinase/CheY-like chemotaxis protein